MRTIFQQEIPRRKQICFMGSELFSPGMDYYSLLKEDETGKWLRHDFCIDCWEKFAGQRPRNQTDDKASYWKSKVEDKKIYAKSSIDRNERALELLLQALAKNSPEDIEEAFILALYLARNKKLVIRKEINHPGESSAIYEILATEELLIVPKLNLSQLQIEKIKGTLAIKLNNNSN